MAVTGIRARTEAGSGAPSSTPSQGSSAATTTTGDTAGKGTIIVGTAAKGRRATIAAATGPRQRARRQARQPTSQAPSTHCAGSVGRAGTLRTRKTRLRVRSRRSGAGRA
eukprot:2026068-Rhodomonas_salina.1